MQKSTPFYSPLPSNEVINKNIGLPKSISDNRPNEDKVYNNSPLIDPILQGFMGMGG